MHLVTMMADEGGHMREYSKGNWTVNETMVLIEAKKMDDERRMKRNEDGGEARFKPTEPRWKWVEDYCWRRGCTRSQNQCNDKWDNLMRDYKKVREYQRRLLVADQSNEKSYWEMEKNERKEKNLPSNMLSQIYELLEDVVEKKAVQKVTAVAIPAPPQQQLPPQPTVVAQPLLVGDSSSDSETNEQSGSQAKRRRRNGEGTGDEVGTAIYKSALVLAEAMQANDENEERRHRDLVGLHERRLKVEESKIEMNRRGIDGVVDVVNKLANSILALASSNEKQLGPM